jgi:hypothetical protein
MTFVGKILVIIIMVFSLFFLAISTVVFSTATSWKKDSEKQKATAKQLQDTLNTTKAEAASFETELANSKSARKVDAGKWEAQKANLDAQSKQLQGELTDQRKSLEVALQNTKIAVEEAEARKKETDELREQNAAVQKQANDYKLRQTELNEQIRVLQREVDIAKKNNSDLRERLAAITTVIRTHNLPVDTERLKRVDNPPLVEGEVSRVDPRNSRVEITIGSDDGLVVGNTLYVYRTKQPDPGYIGRIQLDVVDPDQAVGHVLGRTVQGKKIREGDSVTTKIGPRS